MYYFKLFYNLYNYYYYYHTSLYLNIAHSNSHNITTYSNDFIPLIHFAFTTTVLLYIFSYIKESYISLIFIILNLLAKLQSISLYMKI